MSLFVQFMVKFQFCGRGYSQFHWKSNSTSGLVTSKDGKKFFFRPWSPKSSLVNVQIYKCSEVYCLIYYNSWLLPAVILKLMFIAVHFPISPDAIFYYVVCCHHSCEGCARSQKKVYNPQNISCMTYKDLFSMFCTARELHLAFLLWEACNSWRERWMGQNFRGPSPSGWYLICACLVHLHRLQKQSAWTSVEHKITSVSVETPTTPGRYKKKNFGVFQDSTSGYH